RRSSDLNHPISEHLWMRLTLIRLLATLPIISIPIDLAYITWQNQPRSEVVTTDGTLDRETKTWSATEGNTYSARRYEEPLGRPNSRNMAPASQHDSVQQ